MEWTLFEVLGTLVLAVLLWKIVRHAWSVYFSPLAKLPGPRFALWFPTLSELPYYAAGKAYLRTWDLVRRFGRVVRVANDAIVVADPEAAKLILKTKDLPKSGIYSFLKSPGDPDIMFMAQERNVHRHLRRLISPAFAPSYVASMEPLMRAVLTNFLRVMEKSARSGEPRNLGKDFDHVALDIVGLTAYGLDFGLVTKGEHPLIELRKRLMKALPIKMLLWYLFDWIPGLQLHEQILKRSPIRKIDDAHKQFTKDIVLRRAKETSGAAKPTMSERRDILQMFVEPGTDDDANVERLSFEQIIGETTFIVTAGSETTAISLVRTVYLLWEHPESFRKLRAEIDEAFPDAKLSPEGEDLAKYSYTQLEDDKLRRLPFLDACIKESMRLFPAGALGFNREAEEDIELPGFGTVPKGTRVSVATYTLHRLPEIWQRANEFWPERWIGETEKEEEDGSGEAGKRSGPQRVNKAAYLPFSAGSRNCIGQGFALQEMRLVLSHLIKYYDVELLPGQEDLEKDAEAYVTFQPKGGQMMVKVARRKE